MQTFTIREMRNVLGHLDSLLSTSGEIVLTRHGEPIARILPMQGKHSRPTHAELQRLTKKLSTPSEKIIREARDER